MERIELDSSEKRARSWDRRVTVLIVLALLMPLPFVHFEVWPTKTTVLQRMVMPWSQFRICYTSENGAETREDTYRFTWNGQLVSMDSSPSHLLYIPSVDAPRIKWQDLPEIELKDMYLHGNFLQVKTFWQPLLFWPVRMIWQIWEA